jgi:hypothetical protein
MTISKKKLLIFLSFKATFYETKLHSPLPLGEGLGVRFSSSRGWDFVHIQPQLPYFLFLIPYFLGLCSLA